MARSKHARAEEERETRQKAATAELTVAEKHEQEIIAKLGELGGSRARDTSIQFGTGFTLPVEYKDDLMGAVNYLTQYVADQDTITEYSRTFQRRPWDGAVCMVNAMQKAFGTMGSQKAQFSFFGVQRPEMRTISTGPHGETVQVPWGMIDFPLFKGAIHCSSTNHRTYGMLFQITVHAPKKFSSQVEGFFRLVEEECINNSIYQGKVIDGQVDPEFIDPYVVDAEKVIFSAETRTQLQANIWSPLEYSDIHRELGLPLNRKVLMTGEYGTGKTMTTARTLQVAMENGWTGMVCRPGRDDLDKVMQTARLYQPCVVIMEDIDNAASAGNSDEMSRLLDLFDGVQAKGVEVLGVLTTNHIEDIHQAMLRPGRLDAVVVLGALDQAAVAQMVESLIDQNMLSSIDYDKVYESMEGYPPAFVKESIDRAVRYAVERAQGRPDTITTHDLVDAASGLRPQYEQMRSAGQGTNPDTLGTAMEAHIAKVLTNVGLAQDVYHPIVNGDGGEYAQAIVEVEKE